MAPSALVDDARRWLPRRHQSHPGLVFAPGVAPPVSAETIVGDLWMHGDDQLMTPIVVRHGFWEPELGNMYERLVPDGATFIDVGANIGYFAVMAGNLVGPSGRVIAIEPEPSNLALLTANLWRNGHHQAEVVPTAVYSYTGELVLVVPEISKAACHVDPNATDGIRIPCVCLDELLGDTRIDFLKIDAEGADLEVLRGGARVLERSPQVTVVVEVWTEHEAEAQFGRFQNEGFEIHLIADDGRIHRAGMDEVLTAAAAVTYMNIALRRPGA